MSVTQTQVAVAAQRPESPVVRIEARRGWLALRSRRIVGLPRPGLFFYLARHQGPLQADRHRRGLGGSPAGADHAGLQFVLR